MKLAPKWHFYSWGPLCVPPKLIITAQNHVKLILTLVILAKVLQQPILGPTRFYILKIKLLKNQKKVIKTTIFLKYLDFRTSRN